MSEKYLSLYNTYNQDPNHSLTLDDDSSHEKNNNYSNFEKLNIQKNMYLKFVQTSYFS